MLELSADTVSFSYGRTPVFSGLSFSVKTGETLAVTGPNGSGKTTLLSLCAGLAAPVSGSIEVSGFSGYSSFDFQNESFMVTPNLRWYRQLTLRENFEFFFKKRILPEGAFHMIERFGLSAVLDEKAENFSTGMIQRMTLSAAFALKPRLLAIDEPSSHLDDAGKKVLCEVLAASKPEMICILATHDESEIRNADRSIRLG